VHEQEFSWILDTTFWLLDGKVGSYGICCSVDLVSYRQGGQEGESSDDLITAYVGVKCVYNSLRQIVESDASRVSEQ
jgi:hypothetical protein